MGKIVVLIGLPGSGKGCIAKVLNETTSSLIGRRSVIISLDNIREMLNGRYEFDIEKENLVWSIGVNAMSNAMNRGFDIIVDDCLLSIDKRQRQNLVMMFRSSEYIHRAPHFISAIQMNTPIEVCKSRRVKETKGLEALHWVRAIDELYNRYEPISDDNNEGFDEVRFES